MDIQPQRKQPPLDRGEAEGIEVSSAALEHIQKALAKRAGMRAIRLRIRKAGCSGYEYVVEFADGEEPMDRRFQFDDVEVLIDPKSFVLLKGVRLDFVRQGLNKGFVFENPNEKGRCGCGESFAV